MVSLGNLLGNKVLGYILLVTSFLGNGLLGTAFLESATVPLGTAGVNWCGKPSLMGISLIFVGYPPPRFAYNRIQPHTPAHTRMTFFASFFCVKKWRPLASKREPWRPTNLQKKLKMRTGKGSENNYKNNWKLEALDPRKPCFFIGGVAKITISSLLQKRHQMSAEMYSKLGKYL